MMKLKQFSVAALTLALPLSVSAQQGAVCNTGPGSVFGVVAYQCASCGMKSEPGRLPQYTFFAEPVVVQADRNAAVVAGDVIEAVNGRPITTQAGADYFIYPPGGRNTITVRRGRDRQVIEVEVARSCGTGGVGGSVAGRVNRGAAVQGGSSGSGGSVSSSVVTGGGGVGPGVGGVSVSGSNGAVVSGGSGGGGGSGGRTSVAGGTATLSDSATGRFGFAVECRPSCSMKWLPNGDFYYKYHGFPRVAAVREGSPADRAGMRVGDVITKINGRSIVDDEGVLQRAEQNEQLRLTTRRDGKDFEILLLVTR
jgi:hypothetical protein